MGIDIGVCYYDKKREELYNRYSLLKQLPGPEGKTYGDKLQEISDECFKEMDEITSKKIEELRVVGYRMTNLYFEIKYTRLLPYTISFFSLYQTKRIYPEECKKIYEDIETLLPIISDDTREWADSCLEFFKYLYENNMMMFPA